MLRFDSPIQSRSDFARFLGEMAVSHEQNVGDLFQETQRQVGSRASK